MSPPRLIIFDLDGTLIDSAPDICIAVNAVLGEYGRETLALAEVRRMIGDGAAMLVRRALDATSGTPVDPAQAFLRFMHHYELAPTAHTVLYPGVAATLAALAETGATLAVCTNKPERPTRMILEAFGLGHRFARIVGGDSTPWRKPDPRVLTGVLESLDATADDSAMVGDSEVDAAAAEAAGIPMVLMTYGYRRGPAEGIRCRAALDRFDELTVLFRDTWSAPPAGRGG